MHVTVADKNSGHDVQCTPKQEAEMRAEWKRNEDLEIAKKEGRVLAHKDLTVPEMKKVAKEALAIQIEYPDSEINDAILMNNLTELDKIRARNTQLISAYRHLVNILDHGTQKEIDKEKATFKRPAK